MHELTPIAGGRTFPRMGTAAAASRKRQAAGTARRSLLRAALLCAVCAVPSGIAAGSAQAAMPRDYFAMYSEPGDGAGKGEPHLIDGSPRMFTGWRGGEPEEVRVTARGKNAGESLSATFRPPAGERLEPGEYLNAEGFHGLHQTTPTLEATYGNVDCNFENFGRFTIKDIAFSANGQLERFWAVFEQRCQNHRAPAAVGEVRIGERRPAGPKVVEPESFEWPERAADSVSAPEPITVVGRNAGVRITSVRLAGADPQDFQIVGDDCSGTELRGARCQVLVAAAPQTSGRSEAQLLIAEAGRHETVVPLSGTARPAEAPATATLVGAPGARIGLGGPFLWDGRDNVEVTTGGFYEGGSYIQVTGERTGAGDHEERVHFNFAGPDGARLEPGEYAGAGEFEYSRLPADSMGLGVGGAGCFNNVGRFDVRDVHYNAHGEVDRLWLHYEMHCDGPSSAPTFGEIRIGEPPASTPLSPEPAAVEWPETPIGTQSAVVPVTFVDTAPATAVTEARIEGPAAADFKITGDACTGTVEEPGARCSVNVTATPSSGAPGNATLVLADSEGVATSVALEISGIPLLEVDSATLGSEPGSFLGNGDDWLFDEPHTISIQGDLHHVEITASPGEGVDFDFDFAAPTGASLGPGEYDNAVRSSFGEEGVPGIEVSGVGRGCNEASGRFLVKDIHANPAGRIERFWALYEEHCPDPEKSTVFGEVRYGEAAPETAQLALPSAVRWPVTAVGTAADSVPIAVIAGEHGAEIAGGSLAGPDAGSFTIKHDGCAKATLSPGETCIVWVDATPAVAGEQTAQLVLENPSGGSTTVPLDIAGTGG